MNIFVTNACPIASAKYLDDKRVIKMILESAQMLSTNIFLLSNKQIQVMRPTHANHPCTVWARQTRANAEWLLEHLWALMSEYTARYGNIHAVETRYLPTIIDNMKLCPAGELQPFVNCATHHKGVANVFEAYQLEMSLKWATDKRVPTWCRHKRL